MKKYLQYIKENQQYLTEPYDPDTSTIINVDMDSLLKPIEYQLELLAGKLELKYKITDRGYNNCSYEFEKYPSSYRIRMRFDFEGIRLYSNKMNTMFETVGEIEEYLKKVFKL